MRNIKSIKIILFLFSVSILIPQTEDDTSVPLDELESDGTSPTPTITNDPVDGAQPLTEFQIALQLGNMEKAKELLINAVKVNEENRKEFDRFNDINVKMNDGGRAMKNGQYEEAFSNYEVVMDEFPNFTEAVFSMGLAKFRLSDLESAVNYYSKALELNPEHEKARSGIDNVVKNTFNEGMNTYKRGDFTGAENVYTKVLTYDSTFSRAYFQLGVLQAKMGDYDEAIGYYLDAVKFDSSLFMAWFAMGISQNKMSDESAALESYQNAININPKYSKAYNSMADIYRNNRDYSMALTMLDSALRIDKDYILALNNLGNIYMLLDSVDLAIKNFEKCTLLEPKNVKAWFNLATLHNKLGDCGSAIKAAREATDRKKRFGGGWYELGIAEWCNGKGNKTAALNSLEKAREDRSWRQMAEHEIYRINNPE